MSVYLPEENVELHQASEHQHSNLMVAGARHVDEHQSSTHDLSQDESEDQQDDTAFYKIENIIPKSAKTFVNSVDLLTARVTQATTSLVYKPSLLFVSALGVAISVTWTNFMEMCLTDLSKDQFSSTEVAALWIYAVVLFIATYIPLYLIIRKRINKVASIAEEISSEEQVPEVAYGHVQLSRQVKIIEEGVLNKSVSALIEVSSYLSMNAFAHALQASDPLFQTSSRAVWELSLAFMFTSAVTMLLTACRRAASVLVKPQTKTQMSLERLAEITTSNVSMLIALLFGSALEQFLIEDVTVVSGSTVILGWTCFSLSMIMSVVTLYWKIKISKKKAAQAASSVTKPLDAADDDEAESSIGGAAAAAARRGISKVLSDLTKLESVRDITSISHTLLSKGFVYLSAVTFNNAVMISLSNVLADSPYIPFQSVSTLDPDSYLLYAVLVTFTGLLITVFMDAIIRKAGSVRWRMTSELVLLYNEVIEMLTFAIAFVCGRAWGEALRREFSRGSSTNQQIWISLGVAVFVTFLFILVNAFLVRYFPKNARRLVQQLDQEQHEQEKKKQLQIQKRQDDNEAYAI
eukprot:TRINITY_DN20968_c0_g1_i3.p1 TRINITY_DN20968_c0_g1~~TRINITY_DN20968_c0_g1_i3.p1  ORF type:complete len:578 (+),score=134.96 TRINITY_DN20968_c0_g1_i3:1-1734(+)